MLLVGAAACTSRGPVIGVEAVLAQTGLPEKLLDEAAKATGVSSTIVVDDTLPLLSRFKTGELDLVLSNGDLATEAMLRAGDATSGDALLHHEMVLVGPASDPIGVHAERNLQNALRLILEGDAAFFRCVPCGARAKEDAIFSVTPGLPKRRNAFIDVGKTEDDVVKAMQAAPAYGMLSRPTVARLVKKKEWSFKPMWSGDALQVDVYRLLVRPSERIEERRRAPVAALRTWLLGDAAKKIIEGYDHEAYGPALFRAGQPPPGEGARF